jgi:hypothetical protein
MTYSLVCSFESPEDIEKLIMLAGKPNYRITPNNEVVYEFEIKETRDKFGGKLYSDVRSNLNTFKGRVFLEPKTENIQNEENIPLLQS